MKRLNCLILDDEPLAVDVIENYLQRLDGVDIKRCENALEAFKLLQTETFDIIFLDIEMPFLTGIELLKAVKKPPAVIITTAYRDYAVESFELEVLDYLVKPVSFPRFMKAFERAIRHAPENNAEINSGDTGFDYIFLKVDRKLVRVPIQDILYIESLKDYIKVKTENNTYISYQSLSSITEKLPADKFIRIHRSFTIALDKIKTMEGNFVTIDNALIPISREQKQDLLKKMRR